MTPDPRPYHSPRRQKESLDTRRCILDAGLELFAANGYAHVTVAEIARHAQVALRTVYTSVGNKPEILGGVIARAAEQSGGAEVVAEIRQAVDSREALRLLARGTRAANEANQAIFDLARSTDGLPEAGKLRREATRLYLELLHEAARHLAALNALPPGTPADEATEILWFCFGFEAWTTTTRDLGYDWDAAEVWLLRQAQRLLQIE
jgi:AcrR family transcriptional regulator